MSTDQYITLIEKIIEEQRLIIGPVAVEQANKVEGLRISEDGKVEEIKIEGKKLVEMLVFQYQSLFGRVSVEVCKEAIGQIVKEKPIELPSILQ